MNLATLPGVPLPDLARVETFVFRAAVSKPVVSTLASIGERTSLLVRVEDRDGCSGWGEIYSTLPAYGAEHRAQVLHRTVLPALWTLCAQAAASPATGADIAQTWQALTRTLHAWSLQTGEPGPLAAVLGGLDCALWDLAARQRGLPLYRLLAGADTSQASQVSEVRSVPAYASGLNPADGIEVVARCRGEGWRAFKQKIGFGPAIDRRNLQGLCEAMQPGEALMVDVNQGWSLAQVREHADLLNAFALAWVEEPLQADQPDAAWLACRDLLRAPLAGGENLRGAMFETQSQWLSVLQPDVGKWGGISGGWQVARAALARGQRYCPHWLGSGLGLMASAHLLAAAGGDGLLEVDVNENPLRELLGHPFARLVDGRIALPATPGIGVAPQLQAAAPWQVSHHESLRP